MTFPIEVLPPSPRESDLDELGRLLRDAVESGASVGFMLPVREAEIVGFWQDCFSEVAAGKRIIVAAREGGRIIGSAQLALAMRPNSLHRAELQKLLVLRTHRRRGFGAALIHAVESAALTRGRTLVILDTSASGNALNLYHRCGYTRVGAIPGFARDPDGPLIDTVLYYKTLTA